VFVEVRPDGSKLWRSACKFNGKQKLIALGPYPDVSLANGRVGRLLITFLLCEKGVLHKPVLYLSHYFKRHRQRYYELLQATRDDGDWETWLEFFLRGVSEVSAQDAEAARRILALREDHRSVIAANLGRGW